MRITKFLAFAIATGCFVAGPVYAFTYTQPLFAFPDTVPFGAVQLEAVDVSQGVPASGGDGGSGNYSRDGVLYTATSTGEVYIGFKNELTIRDVSPSNPVLTIRNYNVSVYDGAGLRTIRYGRIGIGTTNPLSPLSVGTDASTGAAVSGKGYYGLYGVGSEYGAYALGYSRGVSAQGVTEGVRVTGETGVYGEGPGWNAQYGYVMSGYGVYGRAYGYTYVSGNTTKKADGWGVYCLVGGGGKCGGNHAWSSPSDIRLKKNIETITDALDTVTNLRGVTFDWKEGGSRDMGFIAQEALPYVPEVVSYDEERDEYSMKTSQLTAFLVEAVKELKEETDEEVEELRSALCDIKPESCE